jgi:hypothetical protein
MNLYYSNEKANIVNLITSLFFDLSMVLWYACISSFTTLFYFHLSIILFFHNSIILFLISHTYVDSVMKPLIQYQRMQSRSQLNFLLISNILYCFFSDKVIS